MPCKRQSDDADHVSIDPKTLQTCQRQTHRHHNGPSQTFAPLAIENELTYGQGNLPDGISSD